MHDDTDDLDDWPVQPAMKRNSLPSGYHFADPSTAEIDEHANKVGTDGSYVDEAVMGCVSQVRSQDQST